LLISFLLISIYDSSVEQKHETTWWGMFLLVKPGIQ